MTSSRLESRRFAFLQLPLPVITYISGTDAQGCSTLYSGAHPLRLSIKLKIIGIKITVPIKSEKSLR